MLQSDARTVEQHEERAEPQLWRIDDLAQHAGVPSRTIRFYNTQGLLPAPRMRGRVAYYEQEHVAVLRIIRELKEQQHLPLEVIKHLLAIRALHGDMQMNLALKQRFARGLSTNEQQVRLSKEELAQRCDITLEQLDDLTKQELLFPQEIDGAIVFTGDDVQLVELYQHFEQLGLPLALPALIRFQLKQLVRSEIAAYEQHVLPRWREEGLSLEEQTEQFEHMLTLADTLLSVMHKKLLYQI
ncbi:MAG: hypothetical protein NVS4B11_12420 [Ktedonobacteraceae bacterium]